MEVTFEARCLAVAETAYASDRPFAVKRGRDPRWPYVPVIIHDDDTWRRQEQIPARAYATRTEAVAVAASTIAARIATLAGLLASPRHRALRVQYGLPAELEGTS